MKKYLTYHWIMVAACFILLSLSIGIAINGFSVFSVFIMKQYETTATEVQLILTFALAARLLGGLTVGKVTRWLSIKNVLRLYGCMVALGLLGWSVSTSITQYYIYGAIMGFGVSGTGLIPCTALITNWFNEKKGTAMGIALTGTLVGGFVFTMFAKYLILTYSLQFTYEVFAVIFIVTVLLLSQFVIKEHPFEKALEPFGQKDKPMEDVEGIDQGISLSKFAKTASFWLLMVGIFLVSFVNMGIQNNLIIFYSKLDYEIGFLMSWYALTFLSAGISRPILGFLYDRLKINAVQIGLVILLIFVVAILLLPISTSFVIAGFVVSSIAGAMVTVTPSYTLTRIAGKAHYASIFGVAMLFYTAGMMLGPVTAAKIFDITESYLPAWFLFIVLSILMGVTLIFAFNKGKEYSKWLTKTS